jgi:hypothetical protein
MTMGELLNLIRFGFSLRIVASAATGRVGA